MVKYNLLNTEPELKKSDTRLKKLINRLYQYNTNYIEFAFWGHTWLEEKGINELREYVDNGFQHKVCGKG